jgi:hypothetical protein
VWKLCRHYFVSGKLPRFWQNYLVSGGSATGTSTFIVKLPFFLGDDFVLYKKGYSQDCQQRR